MADRSVKRVARVCFWDRPSRKPKVTRSRRRRLTSSRFEVDRLPVRVAMWIGGDDPERSRWWFLMRWDYLFREGRRNGRIFRYVDLSERGL